MNSTTQKNPWPFFVGLFVSSLASLFVFSYLTLQHFQVKLGLTSGPSICNINATFNCDVVAASTYSSLFHVPVAMFGAVAHFIFLLILIVYKIGLIQDSARVSRYIFHFSILFLLASLGMGFISLFYMKAYCIFCLSAYALSLLILFFAYQLKDGGALANLNADVVDLFKDHKWVLIMSVGIVPLSFFANAMVAHGLGASNIEEFKNESLAAWAQSPYYEFLNDKGLIVNKNPSAKITVVEFADFLCPHCKFAYPSLHAFAESHPDVQFIFKPFPLDGACNKAMEHNGDGLRCKLAYFAFCAESSAQKGWATHHWIFEHQEAIYEKPDLANFKENIKTDLGIELDSLKTCMDSSEVQDLVLNMAKEGGNAKVPGTPAIYVNGRKLDRAQALPILDAAYELIKKGN